MKKYDGAPITTTKSLYPAQLTSTEQRVHEVLAAMVEGQWITCPVLAKNLGLSTHTVNNALIRLSHRGMAEGKKERPSEPKKWREVR